MTKQMIRTPEERFENLPDYALEPHYLDFHGARMHYVDEGKGDVILCLHGEPSWSYLYRKMIPILNQAGRVIAPDMIGFGKSDKYTRTQDYSYQMHYDSLANLIEMLDLRNVTVVVQDWGGLLGLPLATDMPDRFARLVIMNTALPSGMTGANLPFKLWKAFARWIPVLPVGAILQIATVSRLRRDVLQAYKAPYPNRKYMAGAKVFPELVPVSADIPGVEVMKRTREKLREWDKPALVMFSDRDPIMRGGGRFFRRLIATATEQPKITIRNAGHFLQEDKGEEIAGHIIEFIQRTPLD
jgi:haloalkane dehalogenase